MRTLHTAELLYSPHFPSPVVDYAILLNEEGTILSVGPIESLRDEGDRRFDHQILMPGVVNAHIHLTDAGRTNTLPGGEGLIRWVGKLMSDRSSGLSPEKRENAFRTTLKEMGERGTVAIGEVVNNGDTIAAIRESGIGCRLIHELISFRLDRIDGMLDATDNLFQQNEWSNSLRYGLGAHAPYSVAPELMQAIVERSRGAGRKFYQHLAEDPDERELYEKGTGPWADFLKEFGAWRESWGPPGMSPIPFYDRLGFLDDKFVAVHLADASKEEIALLGARGVGAILSPTSNLHITGRFPDVQEMVAAGITLGIGTDGRGSNPSMDVFDEASLLLERAPELPAGTILRALTSGGASLLGFDSLGSLRVGTRPGLVSIQTNESLSSELRNLERIILARDGIRTGIV